jgi:plastocyanin
MAIVQIRRGTTSQWAQSTKILKVGEIGIDTTLNKLKIGNGTSLWINLPFIIGDTGAASTVPGPKGDTGNTGATGTAGTAGAGFGIYYLGNYVSTNGYLPEIAVVRGSDGQLYLAKASGQLGDPINYQTNGQWEVWIPKGATGATGAAGTAGTAGAKGDTGLTGAQGLQGLTGPQGLKGDTGSAGSQGIQGLTGSQGLKGDTGETGPQGLQGLKGDTGLTGPAGAATFNGQTDASSAGLTIDRIAYPAITMLDVTNSGASAYLFMNQYGGSNPTIYAISGTTIAFNLNVSGHPFLIRFSGSNYDTGLIHVSTTGAVSTGTNAQGKTSGTLYWQIPQGINGNYGYLCSLHSGMAGPIVVKDIATL